MITKRRSLILALVLPIVSLMILTAHKKWILTVGREIELPIFGYDPRDLLSGHYLIYQIDYGIEGICNQGSTREYASICLEPKSFSYGKDESCAFRIDGECRFHQFWAGIEKFYIPEAGAQDIEKKIREKKATIVISVTRGGHAQVKDLRVEGVSITKSKE